MSSMSSATLTPVGRPRPARRWLAPLVLILLALLYSALALPWTARTFGSQSSEEEDTALVVSGPLAEIVEEVQAGGGETDLRLYGDLIGPVFDDEDALAYVRIWDPKLRLTCEITRGLTAAPRAGNGGRLPDLGFTEAVQPAQARLRDKGWVQTIADLQELLANQREVTELLRAAIEKEQSGASAISGTYVLQDDALKLAELLRRNVPALTGTLTEMRAVLDALTDEDAEAIQRAAAASERAEAGLSMVLVEHRVSFDTITALPPVLAKAESGAHWPFLRGRRAILPLFVPAVNDTAVTHAGYAEVGFYDRPLPAMLALAATPAAVLLLAALLTALLGGRKRKVEEMEETE